MSTTTSKAAPWRKKSKKQQLMGLERSLQAAIASEFGAEAARKTAFLGLKDPPRSLRPSQASSQTEESKNAENGKEKQKNSDRQQQQKAKRKRPADSSESPVNLKKSKKRRQKKRRRKLQQQQQPDLIGSPEGDGSFPVNPLLDFYETFHRNHAAEMQRLLHPKTSASERQRIFDLLEPSVVERFSWAIPTKEALRIIAEFSPIVEIGCGLGYVSLQPFPYPCPLLPSSSLHMRRLHSHHSLTLNPPRCI